MAVRLRGWSLALVLPGLALSADPPAATEYTVLLAGLPKGEMRVSKAGGERRITYRYQDRGRGPELTAVRRDDSHGIPQSFSVSGLDYRKMAVSERFTAKNGLAEWVSEVDRGSSSAKGFYFPNESTPEDYAALARAVMASGAHRLALLPAGRASIQKVTAREVKCPTGKVQATLYLIGGVDFEPQGVWLDEKSQLFSQATSWLGVIRKGCEAVQPDLEAAQTQALKQTAEANAAKLRHQPEGALIIRNAKIFDAERRELIPNSTVVIRGDRIESVGADKDVAAPAGAEVLDAKGKVLLPGLWDMHVHVQGQNDGVLDLMAGVTTVRDLANDKEQLQRLSDWFDRDVIPGPHIIKAGIVEGPGPFAGPTQVLCDTPEQVRQAVEDYAASGYVQIKLYSSLKPVLVPVAVEAAHAKGLRVSGHIPAGMTMREAVEAGYDEVQHANFWFLNFMGPEVQAKTNTQARFIEVGKHAHELDLNSPKVHDFISLLKTKGTVVDPTLVVFEGLFMAEKGKLVPSLAPWEARLPPVSSRINRQGGRATTVEERATYAESFQRMKQMLKKLFDAGIPIVAGTDGSSLEYSRELELYVESGVPPVDVLYMATLGSARVMKMESDTGSIIAGKRADLVLVDGNPLERMSDIRRTRQVIKNGVLYDASSLAQAGGLAP